jgi:predicted porin
MNKSVKWIFGISASFLAGATNAQSTVTLYGVLDEGLNFTNNVGGHTAWQMHSSDTFASRWGLKGAEDLGYGYKAIFTLENGFLGHNGAVAGEPGQMFNRQAFVGVSSDRYGQLTLGRQVDPTIDMWSATTGVGRFAGSIANHPFDNDNADWQYRLNNSVKYVSPTYRGITAEGMYAFSNDPSGFKSNNGYGGALRYENGGLTTAVAYLRINNPGTSSGALTSDAIFAGSAEQHIDAGVSYHFDKASLALAYSRTDVYDPTYNVFFSSAGTQLPRGSWNSWKFNNFDLSGTYNIQPDLWVGADYTFTYAKLASTVGDFTPKWHQIALMLNYDLSKRTSLYVQAAYQHVVSAHTGTEFDDAQVAFVAAGPSSSESQAAVRVAMIHRF